MIDKLITLSNLSRFKQKLDELYEKIDHASQTYVEKESGKGLSTNDYTTTEKNKLAGIADGAQVNVKPDWNAAAGNAAEILNKPTIPTVGTGVLTITRNSSQIGTFSANASSNESIDIVVPTTAADVDALPDTTNYAVDTEFDIDDSYEEVTDTTGKNPANEGWYERSGTSPNYTYTKTEDTTPASGKTYYTGPTYVITLQLKDQDGGNLGTAKSIDLPLESVVVSGRYDSVSKKVILTLKDGSTVEFSVADLVSGLQSEITSANKLSADLVEDGNTNKVFTATEQTKLAGIESGAQANVIEGVTMIDGQTDSSADASIANKKAQLIVANQNDIDALNGQINGLRNQLNGLQGDLDAANARNAQLQRDLDACKKAKQPEPAKAADPNAKYMNVLVHFKVNKTNITPDQQANVERVAMYLKNNPSATVEIK